MAATRALSVQNDKFSNLGFRSVTDSDQIVSYSRGLDSFSDKNPIMVLVHGYPSSAYMWRLLIPLLGKDAPIFVPDLPGYGGSKALASMDKLSVGNAILSALKRQLPSSNNKHVPIILIGHDRGARVSHRLSVSGFPGFSILGVCLIDIVPTSTQWHDAASAADAAKAITGYFHWPFLANVHLATRMITAYGGATWCEEMIRAWAGKNTDGLKLLESEHSMAVYGGFFDKEEVIRASCEDYKHGATTDLVAQEEDQKEGRKISQPLLLVYAQDYIGSRYDFSTVWRDWVDEGVEITHHGLGDGVGHFGAEEAPQECAKVINEWVQGLGENARL
ncbi:Alpha/Beta hydrolase protein [Ampelomyces quisqualis]|uniref:Alpha/Beta hydrolase protein n=1 Tax=Ampelomyces quisqualis TaxID=50730 RepID=A0A6A5QM51_AMPQU|nr:Alpha/Beta hydrolase protein [Ampelomyces quisqualis]